MSVQLPSTHRHFTEAARAAAIEARRRRHEERAAVGLDHLEVFVVRASELHLRFLWEIRRFGGIVLDRSTVAYSRRQEARTAGNAALSSYRGQVR